MEGEKGISQLWNSRAGKMCGERKLWNDGIVEITEIWNYGIIFLGLGNLGIPSRVPKVGNSTGRGR